MSRFAVYGTGGFGREILPIVRKHIVDRAATGISQDELVFVDDTESSPTFGIPVISFADLRPGDRYTIAIADGKTRKMLDMRCENAGLIATTISASSCYYGEGVTIGVGGIFCHQAMVTASATIGRQFHCNHFSYVSHDCIIGDYVTFAPRVYCSGNVHIGDLAYIGTGAILKQGRPDKPLVIGRGAVVGMGAVVTKDVAEGETVVGNPARPLR